MNHETTSHRAMIAASVANLERGTNRFSNKKVDGSKDPSTSDPIISNPITISRGDRKSDGIKVQNCTLKKEEDGSKDPSSHDPISRGYRKSEEIKGSNGPLKNEEGISKDTPSQEPITIDGAALWSYRDE